jgi:tetratricopeptide (TPR) repeat protein
MNRIDIHNVMATAFVAAEKYIANALELQKKLELAVEGDDDYALLYTALERHMEEIDQWQATLQDTQKNLKAFEDGERFSEQWWHKERKRLYKVLRDNEQEGLRQWLQNYTEALIAWKLAICKKLVNERFLLPDEAFDVRKLCERGVQAIEDKNYLQALDLLTFLGQQASVQSPPDDISHATLLVFAGRIYLYEAANTDAEKAKRLFVQAKALAPNDGLPYAALGSYYHKVGDARQAEELYRQANELSPTKPDGYIGLGLLAEDQASWDEATDWYNEAIEAVHGEKDIEVTLTKLLAPVSSGRLYLQLARAFERQDAERALRAVELAMRYGIKCDEGDSEPLSHQLKGKLLAQLGKQTESAKAYFDAGDGFYARGEYETAVKQFARATQLQPDLVRAYWYWADTLLMLSYITETPYVDKDYIKDSLKKWDTAKSIKQPNTIYAWVYLTRAHICDQHTLLPDTTRWSLWWQAITYVEQAILLKHSNDPIRALLSQFHRYLNNDANALSLTRIVLNTKSEDPQILSARAAILANVGESIEAEKAISQYLVQRPDDSDSGERIKAGIFLHKQCYEDALTLLNKILERDPGSIEFRDLRASCYLLLDQSLEAVEDYCWIWNKYSPDERNNANFYATAAYHIDKIEEAINIVQERFNDPSWEPGKASCMLGLCYLVQQKFEEGEELLRRGIEQMTNKRQLDDVYRDFVQLEKRALIWSSVDQSRLWSGLNWLKKDIEMQRDKVACPRSPEEEMKQVIKKYPHNSEMGNWAWIGAQATLARIYSEENRWREAAETYQLLLQSFPEARIGLVKARNNLEREGKKVLNEYA